MSTLDKINRGTQEERVCHYAYNWRDADKQHLGGKNSQTKLALHQAEVKLREAVDAAKKAGQP